jgi:MarR family transcriptional regulator for hemolysin
MAKLKIRRASQNVTAPKSDNPVVRGGKMKPGKLKRAKVSAIKPDPLAALHVLNSAGLVPEVHVKVHPDLKKYFGYCLYKAAVQMRYLLDKALAEEGLIAAHFGILRLLKTTGAQNQITLCDSLSIDRASMVKLIDGLQAGEFVERRECVDDRRAKIVKLTARGAAKSEAILKIASSIEEKMLAPLTQQERDVVRGAIPKLLDFSLGK